VIQVCSVVSQLLQLFSRGAFAEAVKKQALERGCQGLHLLGTVRGHAVLSGGADEVAARGLQGLGEL
jgi:hypothetical protein